jgi:hypothetical protein
MSVSFAEFRVSTFRTGQARTQEPALLWLPAGRGCIFKEKINLSTSRQAVSVKEIDRGIWVSLGTTISVTSI